MKIVMPYDCLKKPLNEMSDRDREMQSSYMNTWYVNNCAPWRDTRYRGWLEERRDVDTIVREFMNEYHIQPEGFNEIRELMLAMVNERQINKSIHKWYFDNCAIGKKSARFNFVTLDSLPDEVLDCMMREFNLPEERRQSAGEELWDTYHDDFEMWCS